MDKINNKNAREKALLEEAYGSVYSEDTQKPRIASSRDENGREVFHVLDKHGKSVYKASYFKVAEHWLREYYDILMAEDEQNPDADTYDKQGRKLGIVAELEDEDAESREERADVDRYEYEQGKEAGEREHSENAKKVLSAVEDFRTMYIHELDAHAKGAGHPEDLNLIELRDAHAHLSRALHHLVDESDVDYIMGREVEQEYDMDLDPQGRREADPREW